MFRVDVLLPIFIDGLFECLSAIFFRFEFITVEVLQWQFIIFSHNSACEHGGVYTEILFEWTLNSNFVIFFASFDKGYAVRRRSTTSLLQYKQYGFVKNAFTQAAPRVFYLCRFTPKSFLHLASSRTRVLLLRDVCNGENSRAPTRGPPSPRAGPPPPGTAYEPSLRM